VKKEINSMIQIFHVLPKRYQGMVFMLIFFAYINLVLTLINLVDKGILKTLFSLLMVASMFFIMYYFRDWIGD